MASTVRAIESWSELDTYCVAQIDNLWAEVNDGETIGSAGPARHDRAQGATTAYETVRRLIAPMVAVEADEWQQVAAEDGIEQRYKAAGFDDMAPLEQWRRDGYR